MLSLLLSDSVRLNLGMFVVVGEVYLAVARVAGAREKRRPICTVALLSVLACRLLLMAKNGFGLSIESNS
jgi:energy-converting hydrogenase Eha subunit C